MIPAITGTRPRAARTRLGQEVAMLFAGKGVPFAGRPAGGEPVHALGDQPVHLSGNRAKVQAVILRKRRREGRDDAPERLKHGIPPGPAESMRRPMAHRKSGNGPERGRWIQLDRTSFIVMFFA